MACRLAVILLSAALLSLFCSTLQAHGGSVGYDAADLVPAEGTTEGPPEVPAIIGEGTSRNCGNCKCCYNNDKTNCIMTTCCKELTCYPNACVSKSLYCGCDPNKCV